MEKETVWELWNKYFRNIANDILCSNDGLSESAGCLKRNDIKKEPFVV